MKCLLWFACCNVHAFTVIFIIFLSALTVPEEKLNIPQTYAYMCVSIFEKVIIIYFKDHHYHHLLKRHFALRPWRRHPARLNQLIFIWRFFALASSVSCENTFTFDTTQTKGTTYHDLAQLSISRLTRSELVLGPHPRDVYTARLPPPEWKERECSGYKFSAMRRRKFRYRKITCIAPLTIYAPNVIVYVAYACIQPYGFASLNTVAFRDDAYIELLIEAVIYTTYHFINESAVEWLWIRNQSCLH